MTWKNIIDTNNHVEFNKKADSQNYVFVLYSTKSPYLPVDIAYSTYEIYKKYGIPLATLQSGIYRSNQYLVGGYIIKKY